MRLVLGELAVGFRQGMQQTRNEVELERFLANSVVGVLPVTDVVADIYADIVLDLKRAGTPLPTNDIWIVAVAVRHGASVLTYDTHFRTIARASARVLD